MWVLKSPDGRYIKTRESEGFGGHGEGRYTCLHISPTMNPYEARMWSSFVAASKFALEHRRSDYTTSGEVPKGYEPVEVVMKEVKSTSTTTEKLEVLIGKMEAQRASITDDTLLGVGIMMVFDAMFEMVKIVKDMSEKE